MSEAVKSIKDYPENNEIDYSICTIVNDMNEYHLMKDSFESSGFTGNCEYLVADNSQQNIYDAYHAIGLFLKHATGKYIVIVHQDVRCIDNRKVLDSCLDNLNEFQPNWGICGNAGAKGYHQYVINITDPSHKAPYPNLPEEVNSLDENLLIIKRASNITISPNLIGYHLYGTDLCIIAKFLGYQCFVIGFLVEHLSKGNLKDLQSYKNYFIERYGKKMSIGFIQTTCTSFYLSNSTFKNRFFNSTIVFFFIKQFKRYPYLIRELIKRKS